MAAKLRAPVKVIHGDALQVMSGMPAASVDAIITDPPYCSGAVSEASKVQVRMGWRRVTIGNPARCPTPPIPASSPAPRAGRTGPWE
jgi:hypothetical protein